MFPSIVMFLIAADPALVYFIINDHFNSIQFHQTAQRVGQSVAVDPSLRRPLSSRDHSVATWTRGFPSAMCHLQRRTVPSTCSKLQWNRSTTHSEISGCGTRPKRSYLHRYASQHVLTARPGLPVGDPLPSNHRHQASLPRDNAPSLVFFRIFLQTSDFSFFYLIFLYPVNAAADPALVYFSLKNR